MAEAIELNGQTRRKQEEFMDKYLFEDVMVAAIIVVMAAFAIAVVLSIL